MAYPVDYTKHQGSDFGYDLKEGDEVEGQIITAKVEPYIVNGEVKTKCTVPVFCSEDDPIEFEVQLERAVLRAGKILAPGQLKYAQAIERNPLLKPKIPENCLVVKTYKKFD